MFLEFTGSLGSLGLATDKTWLQLVRSCAPLYARCLDFGIDNGMPMEIPRVFRTRRTTKESWTKWSQTNLTMREPIPGNGKEHTIF